MWENLSHAQELGKEYKKNGRKWRWDKLAFKLGGYMYVIITRKVYVALKLGENFLKNLYSL
jgi:hypothetical protein